MNQAAVTSERIAQRLRIAGAMSVRELQTVVPLSQPQLSRYLKNLHPQVMKIGSGRSSRYFHTRDIPMVGERISVYAVDQTGTPVLLGVLIPAAPRGFYWDDGGASKNRSRMFDDLPYFLNDLRPSGYLGRLIPRLHPEWEFPEDIRFWSADITLRYLTRFGSDLVGNLVLGELAVERVLSERFQETPEADYKSDGAFYEELAQQVESKGIPGSSAAGEHPKFLARRPSDGTPVIVKFVRNGENPVTERRVDLLRAEKVASDLLSDPQPSSARIIDGARYTFLEVVRFDRVGRFGRRGVISLASLDAELLGGGENWTRSAQKLLDVGAIDRATFETILFRDYFGQCIGNSDMHSGNLSFFSENENVLGLAPSYDMLPMLYSPVQERLPSTTISVPTPSPASIAIWETAMKLAIHYWRRIQETAGFSAPFVEIASKNEKVLSKRFL